MKKIKDRILLGIVSGIIAGVPGRLLNLAEYHVGLTDIKYGQLASNLFLAKNKVNTKEGKLIGYIVNQINLGITGVTISYLLSATGRDKAILKGAGVTSMAWLVLYGLTSRLNITVKSKNKRAPLFSFLDHIILGSLCGWLTSRLGDDALFKRSISKRGSASLRKTGYEIMTCIKIHKPSEDDAVYQYMLKKETEGKHKKVAKIAALNKFLRIYYARVKESYVAA